MKLRKRFLQLAVFSVVISLTACGGGSKQSPNKQSEMTIVNGAMSNQFQFENPTEMHQQYNIMVNNFEHQDIVILDQVYQPADETNAELEKVIDAYVRVTDALVKDNEQATGKTVDLMYGKGAYWISDSKVIKNPYMGAKMPICGVIKEEL